MILRCMVGGQSEYLQYGPARKPQAGLPDVFQKHGHGARKHLFMLCMRLRLENLGSPDGDAEGSFASLADTIMQQLLSKDVLYQPMKDIGSKYPTWLATHRSVPALSGIY